MAVSQSNSLAKANKLAGYVFYGGYTEVLPYSQVIVRIGTTSASNSYILSIYYSNNKTSTLVVNSTEYTNQIATVVNSGPQGAYVKIHVELLSNADNLTIDTMFKSTTIYDVTTASLGSVTVSSGNIVVDSITAPVPVTGSFYPETQPVSIANSVAVKNGVIDAPNSSDVPLLVGQTFLGYQKSTLDIAQISVSCETDASGTLNIHFSSNGFNPGYTVSRPIIANGLNIYNHEPIMNYFFIEVIPDADQTFLRLTTTVRSVASFIEVQQVSIADGPLAVTGSFYQATQPISIAEDVTVTGTFFQATQPVSGTVLIDNTEALDVNVVTLPEGPIDVSGSVSLIAAADPSLTIGKVRLTDSYGDNIHATAGNMMVGINNIYTTNALHTIIDSIDSAVTFLTQERPTSQAYFTTSVGTAGLVVSAGPKVLRSFCINTSSALAYIYLYDMVLAPVAGDTPVFVFPIQSSNNIIFNSFDHQFTNGIGIRATTTYNGAVAPAANSVFVNMTLSD